MDYSEKLRRLRARRQGFYTKGGDYLVLKAQREGFHDERFQKLAEPEPVKYALGAMQAVDAAYTKKCYAEGDRVSERLAEGMRAASIPVEFDYQGSVPLNVHVRGNSDVDLLLLHAAFVTSDAEVKKTYGSMPYKGRPPTEELQALRAEAIEILARRYYEADVEAGRKAITVSGGSLERVIDVIPSHWHDTLAWRRTGDKSYREIYILDAKEDTRIHNLPFMHIKRVGERCDSRGGALRKVIRLLKNVRYDADPVVDLSSYDIAAIAFHMSDDELTVAYGHDLLLLNNALGHLGFIVESERYREVLRVPDGSRKIFDIPQKLTAATRLMRELATLARDVAGALQPTATTDAARSAALSKSIAF